MVFDYAVKYNGIFYPVGADVPMGEEKPVVKTEKKVVDEPIKEEATTKISKADVEAVNNVMKLRKMAKDNGVAVANDMSASEIKDLMITVLGL